MPVLAQNKSSFLYTMCRIDTCVWLLVVLMLPNTCFQTKKIPGYEEINNFLFWLY